MGQTVHRRIALTLLRLHLPRALLVFLLILSACRPLAPTMPTSAPTVATLTANPAASPTPAQPVPVTSTEAPPATPSAPPLLLIGSVGPLQGWQDWSWGEVDRNFKSADLVYSGTDALALTFEQGWSGFKLGRNDPVDVSAYTVLRFWVHGGERGGQRVQLQAGDGCVSTSLEVTLKGGAWQLVELPLLDLGVKRQIDFISWFNPTDQGQPVFHLDEAALIPGIQPTPAPLVPVADLLLSVDGAAPRRPISPLIYGMNYADEALAQELNLPVRRWGGNATTRYNWRLDVANRAADWYFENIPESDPGTLPDGSSADRFIEQDRRSGTQTLLTIPIIGWTPKSREKSCGFSIQKYGPQRSFDPWSPDCGDGFTPDGEKLSGNDPKDTSLAITPAFVQGWIDYLTAKYGTAEQGGVAFYALDNEPMLWPYTHRDVHPEMTSYDELLQRSIAYARAVKASDPTAQVLGPAVWGWTAFFYSALDTVTPGFPAQAHDRLAHGDLPLLQWYLAEMRREEEQNGTRLLDYLDVHFYPQADGVFSAFTGDASTRALRLRSTRSLWDPAYADESWIGETVYLIPRLRQWIDEYYPGTKLALTEYSWGAHCHINGALAQADLLGIFGRDGLDLATLWAPPQPDQPGAFAFRIYLNADGQGAKFGQTSLSAASSDPDRLTIYAAERASDGALTLMVINKSEQDLAGDLQLRNFAHPFAGLQAFRYSAAQPEAILSLPPEAIRDSTLRQIFPASSITLLVLQ